MTKLDLNPISVLRKHGPVGALKIASCIIHDLFVHYREAYRIRNAVAYINPSEDDFNTIETALSELGISMCDLYVDIEHFKAFKNEFVFSKHYIGEISDEVRDEKLFEHFLAYTMLELDAYGEADMYLDIAAGSSPWAHMLRYRRGINAYAIDFRVIEDFKPLGFYVAGDATAMAFESGIFRGASLQCAYEMFAGDADIRLMNELARVLKKGGKVLIVPLYLHTHYCCYASKEYYGKGYADTGSKEYLRADCGGVRTSRKYDAYHLKKRVLDQIEEQGMSYRLHVVRNAKEVSKGIYCRYVLEITK